jgi:hypothetical protein
MPKPRTLRKEQRRLARQIATANAAAALAELAASPPTALPTDDARDAYRAQINHHITKLSRAHAHNSTLARGDSGSAAGPSDGESGA